MQGFFCNFFKTKWAQKKNFFMLILSFEIIKYYTFINCFSLLCKCGNIWEMFTFEEIFEDQITILMEIHLTWRIPVQNSGLIGIKKMPLHLGQNIITKVIVICIPILNPKITGFGGAYLNMSLHYLKIEVTKYICSLLRIFTGA